MDPSIFFGRSRVTRQTSKPQEPSTDKENVKSEVKSVKKSASISEKTSKRTLVEVRNEVIPTRRNAARSVAKKSENIVKSKDTSRVTKGNKTQSTKKVCFSDNTPVENEDQKVVSNAATSGPVYRNVQRSDVRDDPVDEYAFEFDSSSESAEQPKKKKKRQTQKKKTPKSIVKWNPSKKPALKPTKPPTKKSKPEEKIVTVSTSNKTTNKNIGNEEISSTQQPTGTLKVGVTGPITNCTSLSKQELVPTLKEKLVVDHPRNSPFVFQVEKKHFTSTPTVVKIPSRLHAKNTRLINSPAEVALETTQDISSSMKERLSKALSSAQPLSEIEHMSPVSSSPLSSTSKQFQNSKLSSESRQCNASIHVESSLKNLQRSTPLCTPVRKSPCISIPTICVRESPSFMEPEPVSEVPIEDTPIPPASPLQSEMLDTVTSTPVTRSKSVVSLKASISAAQLNSSPTAAEEPSLKSADFSKLFDDLPRSSVIPTRMFSTHRGTIFKPEEDNTKKRKIPELSPSKKQVSSRATTVKFSVPQSSSGVHDCFGFEEDDSPFIPKSNPAPILKKVAQEQIPKKPNLSVQDVQALLRGQLQLASPANGTPRSIQLKLTDFVNSTPTASTRSKQRTNQVVLTPTPVPLFGEENLDTDIPSPFTQASRRSYDRFRPVKRIACGDEVLSDDEVDENDANQNATKSTGVELKKKSRSYRKKKKPEETQLDNWAQQMAAHFNEVENVDLEIK